MNAIVSGPPPQELAAIVTEVDRQLRGRLRHFHVAREEQGLVLLGAAPSFYVKQLAQHAVGRLTRLPIARNEIQVLENRSLWSRWPETRDSLKETRHVDIHPIKANQPEPALAATH